MKGGKNMKKIIIPVMGVAMLLVAFTFGARLNKQDAAHAQSTPVQQVKQAEPDKETNDDALNPAQSTSAQNKVDVNENEKPGPDTDSQQHEDAV